MIQSKKVFDYLVQETKGEFYGPILQDLVSQDLQTGKSEFTNNITHSIFETNSEAWTLGEFEFYSHYE